MCSCQTRPMRINANTGGLGGSSIGPSTAHLGRNHLAAGETQDERGNYQPDDQDQRHHVPSPKIESKYCRSRATIKLRTKEAIPNFAGVTFRQRPSRMRSACRSSCCLRRNDRAGCLSTNGCGERLQGPARRFVITPHRSPCRKASEVGRYCRSKCSRYGIWTQCHKPKPWGYRLWPASR